jgi:riboflavin synthase
MFTGLVEAQGVLQMRTTQVGGVRLSFSHPGFRLTLGESIALSGACLTVVAFDTQSFTVELSHETLALTTLGQLEIGHKVNLERALLASDRLGGHLVTGHVDGVGVVSALVPDGEMTRVVLTPPAVLLRYIAKKGSLTVDGVSLTVNEVRNESVELLLIPHTQAVTTLGALQVGTAVNLEVDILARYVERMLSFQR